MKTELDTTTSFIKIEHERQHFKMLLASNPNYFGNLAASQFKPVKKIVSNTSYEQLHCIGYHQDRDLLEATIHLMRPSGYNGSLCQPGSTEYVRFYIDYGSGWQDLGVSSFNAHDIPVSQDCAKQSTKPLISVVTLQVDPKRNICKAPVLPLVRAILSWETPPPANTPNWPPVWGNVLERHIQIKPRRPYIKDIYDDISASIGKPVKVPPLFEEVQLIPIPLPDPAPDALPLESLAKLYAAAPEKGAHAVEGKFAVAPHRFALPYLQSALLSGGIDQNGIAANIASWEKLGLNWQDAIKALDQTKADVTYEELRCLGLDYNREWLVATVEIKQPSGYSGKLCDPGSDEYVAFWVDWGFGFQYEGTASAAVFDSGSHLGSELEIRVGLPVDFSRHMPAEGLAAATIKVRAVLSWNTPPSTTHPYAPVVWGNSLDLRLVISSHRAVYSSKEADFLTGSWRGNSALAFNANDLADWVRDAASC